MNIRLIFSSSILILIILGITQANQQPTSLSPYAPKGYKLVFFDEFKSTDLDTSRWQHRYTDGHEYGAGVASYDSVVQAEDGYLHLITHHDNETFLTGMLRSVQQFKYGYFEARIRFQISQGHHGAFWLQSKTYGQMIDNPAQSGAEIDIIEFFGNGRIATDAQQNVYYDPYSSEQNQPGAEFDIFYRDTHDGVELSEDFHIFGLQWTPEEYVFFIDGRETWRTRVGLSHVQEYIVLSLTTSEWENPVLDINQLPDEMLVDYVRVYQRE